MLIFIQPYNNLKPLFCQQKFLPSITCELFLIKLGVKKKVDKWKEINYHIAKSKWKKNYKEIGKKHGYTDNEIAEYYDYILLAEKRMIK